MRISLTERMQAIADMVVRDKVAADIGTDHGYIPCYLLYNRIVPSAILADINEDPLNRAKANLDKYGLENASLRLGNGLDVLKQDEAATIIIAGMGGELIEAIIKDGFDKAKAAERIIVQPRTRSDEMRVNLSKLGFEAVEYKLAMEKGRITEVIAYRYNPDCIIDNPVVSHCLIQAGDPLFKDFICNKIRVKKDLIENLRVSSKDMSFEIEKIEKEIKELEEVIIS